MNARWLEPLRRPSLRTELSDRLRQQIADGRIPAGARVNEAELARQAGVSRTPIREALLALAAEGFLESDTGRGFFTGPLTLAEAAETYPILGALEGLSLRLAGIPSRTALDELERINDALGAVQDDPVRSQRLDLEWHTRLLAHGDNRRLASEVDRIKNLVRRYEVSYMRDTGRIERSVAQHRAIVEALRAGRLKTAAGGLELNWTTTFEQLEPWLRERGAS